MGQEQGGYIDSGFDSLSGGGGGYAPDIGGDSFAIDYVSIPDYAAYDPNAPESQLNEPDYASYPDYPSGSGGINEDYFLDYLDNYLRQGYDEDTAVSLAEQGAASGQPAPINIGSETILPSGSPTQLPDTYLPFLSYQTPYIGVDGFPIVPPSTIEAPPPPPTSPTAAQPNLPPACPGGTYHPYPIGHPQQDVCVPFPAQAQTQAPRPAPPASSGSSGSSGATSAPKPQAQQPKPTTQPSTPSQCPTGYYKTTAGCVPIPKCSTPGTVFDKAKGRCVPTAQAQSPGCPIGYWLNPGTRLCEPIPNCATGLLWDVNKNMCVPASEADQEDIFGGLKNIPWWVWAGLGALLLLSKDNNDGRKTTVTYRRAS